MDITEQQIEQWEDEHGTVAYRFVEDKPKIGAVLPHSSEWDGDNPTDEELPGTSTWETLQMAREYAQWSSGWIVAVGGSHVRWGQEAGERLLANATVLAIVEAAGVALSR